MAKAIMETSPDTNLNIGTDEILQTGIDTSGVFLGDQYQVMRICTKRDNDLKAVMEAHMETRASDQAFQHTRTS